MTLPFSTTKAEPLNCRYLWASDNIYSIFAALTGSGDAGRSWANAEYCATKRNVAVNRKYFVEVRRVFLIVNASFRLEWLAALYWLIASPDATTNRHELSRELVSGLNSPFCKRKEILPFVFKLQETRADQQLLAFLTRFLHRRCWPVPAQG